MRIIFIRLKFSAQTYPAILKFPGVSVCTFQTGLMYPSFGKFHFLSKELLHFEL